MSLITLVTDFGLQDGYAGLLKGVIWGICPEAKIADLSHNINPQDILGGALVLERATPYFPPGSIHVGIVDPGVGTDRRPIAAKIGDFFFVGPDNGIIGLLIDHAHRHQDEIEIIHLTNPDYWLQHISQVFHGRDIFAPVAAHLSKGVPLSQLGETIHDPVTLSIPQPNPLDLGWSGQIIHIDHFGNLATNIKINHLKSFGLSSTGQGPANGVQVKVQYGEHTITGLCRSYGNGKPGQLIALIDSSNRLSLSIVNGSAAEQMESSVGDPIEILKT